MGYPSGWFVLLVLTLAASAAGCKRKAQDAANRVPPPVDGAAAVLQQPGAEKLATAGHDPTTPAPGADAGRKVTIAVAGPGGDDESLQIRAWLDSGIALAKERRCVPAIDAFDKVLDFFEQRYDPRKTKVRCGRTSADALRAGLELAAAGGDVTVVGAEWCDALYYKAYCLVELGRFEAAETMLTRACDMMPGDPMYLSELGHAQQRQGKFEASLGSFEKALAAATALAAQPDGAARSPGGLRPVQWQTRALRGIGFAFIEMGRLEDARATYRRALDLDPNDTLSKRQLDYIAGRLTRPRD